ncbi:UTP--glucose-1-phosphate uridylyltransferase GalU [Sporolactobacillus shoreicorticis]|uniref:UTP--glucose-1-phosphate uridylyltransferase n=1 Tax=Sporolactobacillus shoreicorticis TaxID=1923877 RepID=A0ABW5S3I9_9BACL|nr:UTP--glucose-1-phosphate uridylyltransferase GalU [Sporolactobacillus shoreicorticis]MCO7124202.1 UTP--glucose-1-phosphate uridylyltransferase GalU [Sporolactobacillus shoreicorticis]
MKKVKKVVIPAAGLGTRFLPATKALPKEMLPIVNKPTIQYIVEEAIEAGMEEIIIVTGKGKRAIEDHFDDAYELEQNLIHKEKYELLEKVREPSKIDIHYIRQKSPKGLGHAVWCARKFIGDEPFAVLLGDDIVQAEKPCIQQLAEQYEQTGCSVIGVQSVPMEQTQRYGIIDPIDQDGRLFSVRQFVEKPKDNPPSDKAIIGRYILTPEIFQFLDRQEAGAGGEIQLTDAIQQLNALQHVYAYQFEGHRYDVGETLGFVLTNIEMALKNKKLQKDVLAGIETILHDNKLLFI